MYGQTANTAHTIFNSTQQKVQSNGSSKQPAKAWQAGVARGTVKRCCPRYILTAGCVHTNNSCPKPHASPWQSSLENNYSVAICCALRMCPTPPTSTGLLQSKSGFLLTLAANSVITIFSTAPDCMILADTSRTMYALE